MPKVTVSGSSLLPLTGGLHEFDVDATSFRRLVRELEARFPGLGRQVEEGMAIAIDGTIYQDAYDAPIRAESEVYLIPKIGGG